MRTKLRLLPMVLCAISIAILAGCGNGSNLPKGQTGFVRGKITYNDKPVPEGCSVTFMRAEGGLVGTGKTDSSGEYLLYMRNGLDILCGTYRVAIGPPNPSSGLSDDEVMKRSMAGQLPNTADIKEVPDRYRHPETTKEVFEVKPGKNVCDINMKD
jgi:hypothetical protein